MRKQLYDEFARYYREHRCPGAPDGKRVFGLARRLYADYYGRLTPSHFMSVVYQTLDGLFLGEDGLLNGKRARRFEPNKYQGDQSDPNKLHKHFLNMFARRLAANLERSLHPRTDRGRRGDPSRFEPRPRLGLFRAEKVCLQTEWAKEWVRRAVLDLSPEEREVIRGRYWQDESYRGMAKRFGVDYKTVQRRHDHALDSLRDAVA
jgi:RNA polymerase sigma factor (sigma-70 family)